MLLFELSHFKTNLKTRGLVIRGAWQALSQWLWGLLQLFSVRSAAPQCGSSRPAARPGHAGTGPEPGGLPPVCAVFMTI